eukprot:g17859.t1
MLRTRQKAVATHVDKMRQFFEEADTSKDGRIDFQEFEAIMQNKEPSSERSGGQREVKIWLSAMELDVRDVRLLFDLLDRTGDSDGTLSAEELEMYKRGNSNTSSLQSSKPDPFSPAEAPIEEESDAKASPDDVGFRI